MGVNGIVQSSSRTMAVPALVSWVLSNLGELLRERLCFLLSQLLFPDSGCRFSALPCCQPRKDDLLVEPLPTPTPPSPMSRSPPPVPTLVLRKARARLLFSRKCTRMRPLLGGGRASPEMSSSSRSRWVPSASSVYRLWILMPT